MSTYPNLAIIRIINTNKFRRTLYNKISWKIGFVSISFELWRKNLFAYLISYLFALKSFTPSKHNIINIIKHAKRAQKLSNKTGCPSGIYLGIYIGTSVGIVSINIKQNKIKYIRSLKLLSSMSFKNRTRGGIRNNKV